MKSIYLCLLIGVASCISDGCQTNRSTLELETESERMGLEANAALNAEVKLNKQYQLFWNVACAVRCGATIVDVDESVLLLDSVKTYFENQIGKYPHLSVNGETGETRWINGGLPQVVMKDSMLWAEHVSSMKEYIIQTMDSDWSGYAVIDYEDWVPFWDTGRNSKNIYRLDGEYKTASIAYELENDPSLTRREAREKARENFEHAAANFMSRTLEIAQNLRPNAKWGYYGFPGRVRTWHKDDEIAITQNSELSWLFEQADAIYPSIYLLSKSESKRQKGNISSSETYQYIARNIAESIRVASEKPVVPFTWYRYHKRGGGNEYGGEFLTDVDLFHEFILPLDLGADALILWGSSSDKRSPAIDSLQLYMREKLQPVLRGEREELRPVEQSN